jgi:hypothetical protein
MVTFLKDKNIMNKEINVFNYMLAFCITCVVTGLATFIGSVAGHSIGNYAVFVLAIIGGVTGVYLSCVIIIRLKNFKHANFRTIFIGGIIGYITAAITAVNFLHYPFIVIGSITLAGFGVIIGYNINNGHSL